MLTGILHDNPCEDGWFVISLCLTTFFDGELETLLPKTPSPFGKIINQLEN